MLQDLRLDLVGRNLWLDADIVREVRAILGAHPQPDTARLGTIAALQGVDKQLLWRITVMKQGTSGDAAETYGDE